MIKLYSNFVPQADQYGFDINIIVILPLKCRAACMVQWLACWTCEAMVPGSSPLRVWVYIQEGVSSIFAHFSSLQAWFNMTYDVE